jgi:hypothetical protein
MTPHSRQRPIFPLAFLVATVSLFAATSRAADEPVVVDLILVAGQSNAVGYDAKPGELPAYAGDKEILFWYRCGDPPPDDFDTTGGRKWTHLQAVPRGTPDTSKTRARQYGNYAQAEGGFGPEMGLARTLHAKEGKRLAVVKAAFSGTSLLGDWNPKDEGPAGACYRALVSETKAAVAAAKEKNIVLRVRALAWIQGESDANPTSAPKYEQALAEMIASLRTDLAAPDMTALLAVNTRFGGGKNAHMPKIVEAQQAVAAKTPRCAYVDTADCTIANTAHFDSPGTLDAGRRMADALAKVEEKNP